MSFSLTKVNKNSPKKLYLINLSVNHHYEISYVFQSL